MPTGTNFALDRAIESYKKNDGRISRSQIYYLIENISEAKVVEVLDTPHDWRTLAWAGIRTIHEFMTLFQLLDPVKAMGYPEYGSECD